MTTPDSNPAPAGGAHRGPADRAGRDAARAPGDEAAQAARRARALDGEPALPEQSREDTDAGWGEYAEPSDDHLYRDRPPHWADY